MLFFLKDLHSCFLWFLLFSNNYVRVNIVSQIVLLHDVILSEMKAECCFYKIINNKFMILETIAIEPEWMLLSVNMAILITFIVFVCKSHNVSGNSTVNEMCKTTSFSSSSLLTVFASLLLWSFMALNMDSQ